MGKILRDQKMDVFKFSLQRGDTHLVFQHFGTDPSFKFTLKIFTKNMLRKDEPGFKSLRVFNYPKTVKTWLIFPEYISREEILFWFSSIL